MSYKVYLGNLPYSLSENDLKDWLQSLNPVSVTIVRFPDSGKSKGFGFAEFETEESMNEAVSKFNGTELDGRKVVVAVANRDNATKVQEGTRLYVGNLSFNLDDKGLEGVFTQFGEVVSAEVVRSGEGRSKGFGFVEFSDIESAKKAIELNGQEVEGRNIVVRFAIPREKNDRE